MTIQYYFSVSSSRPCAECLWSLVARLYRPTHGPPGLYSPYPNHASSYAGGHLRLHLHLHLTSLTLHTISIFLVVFDTVAPARTTQANLVSGDPRGLHGRLWTRTPGNRIVFPFGPIPTCLLLFSVETPSIQNCSQSQLVMRT